MLTLYRRVRAPLFWLATAFTYAAAILPGPEAPTLGLADKIDHVAAFVTLTLLCRMAYAAAPAWLAAAGLAAFGALIEITQSLPAIGRDGSWLDWTADAVAIAAALALGGWLERRKPALFA
jgi:hypothetical protein